MGRFSILIKILGILGVVLSVGGAAAYVGSGNGGGGGGTGGGSGGGGGNQTSAPEIDPSVMVTAVGVVAGALALIAERRRRQLATAERERA
jgi:hypothetical protein